MIQNSKFKIPASPAGRQNFYTKPFFFLLLSLVVYFGFGLSNITHYSTADEHFWLPNYGSERVQAYWKALAEGNWENTRINDKPGVSIALLSGMAIPFTQEAINTQISFDDGTVKRFDVPSTERINFFFRFPLLLFNGLFIFYFFWILKKITRNDWISLWASLCILLSPIILGISQILNPDTLFWSFGSATLLTFYAYLRKREFRFVWIAMVLFGFTLLSKYVGVIFFPFFFVMILIQYLFSFDTEKNHSTQKPTTASLPPLRLGDSTLPLGQGKLAETVKKDLLAYLIIMLGGVAIFSLLMPAAIVDPKVLYESTIGFPGMLPIFITIFFLGLALLIDASFFKSRILSIMISFLAPKKEIFEKILYTILFLGALFTLLNWMARNSLVDLSHIPFDAKTKASFTTDNPYLARFIAEWVPLLFALTPVTLFLLLFSWAQALYGSLRKRALVFTLSAFFLVFYLAVIEQGLLVTTRYSIILFPFVFILGALSLSSLFFPKTEKEKFFSKYIAPTFIFFLLLFSSVLFFHDSLSVAGKITLEQFIGKYLVPLLLLFIALIIGFFFLLKNFISKITFPTLSPIILTILLFLTSIFSLASAFPHYFLYANDLLPDRYLLFHSWGYGGYEAAQYLNAKPDAKNITLWTDSYGTCEFFVGKCIKKQKVDVSQYRVDYILRTLRGQISPKFPHNTEGKPEWEYAVGERTKNFIRIYKNKF